MINTNLIINFKWILLCCQCFDENESQPFFSISFIVLEKAGCECCQRALVNIEFVAEISCKTRRKIFAQKWLNCVIGIFPRFFFTLEWLSMEFLQNKIKIERKRSPEGGNSITGNYQGKSLCFFGVVWSALFTPLLLPL